QRQHQGQAALLWQAGLDIAATIRVSGGGRKMFLDIPFYRTGVRSSPQQRRCTWIDFDLPKTLQNWRL
ncbi:MAG: hypothetical protein ABR866_17770, partial [Candidatus Korobacteraceae bacterium]